MEFERVGDGKADLCIYRERTSYVNSKRHGTARAIFGDGTTGDVPLAGRFC